MIILYFYRNLSCIYIYVISLNQCYEKSKEAGIINHRFFHILHGEYLLKEKVVVVLTPEWKFKAIITRNITEGS